MGILSEFKFQFDPTAGARKILEENERQQKKMFEASAKRNAEKEARELRSLEIQEIGLENQKLMMFLMQSINRDSKEIVTKLQSLIETVEFGNKVEEGNLFLIEKELEVIKQNGDNIQQEFINIAKEKLAEKGVEYTILFILQGLKSLFMQN